MQTIKRKATSHHRRISEMAGALKGEPQDLTRSHLQAKKKRSGVVTKDLSRKREIPRTDKMHSRATGRRRWPEHSHFQSSWQFRGIACKWRTAFIVGANLTPRYCDGETEVSGS
jgi:hypothetical protein